MATETEIRSYWEPRTCGTNHASADYGTASYFAEIEAERYRREPFIATFADFGRWSGRRVLEIGVGAGTDLVNFVRHGALASGVDLTASAVEHAHRRLALEGLEADVRHVSAEHLPYDDDEFELVWSWGVIHHAEHPERALREARRVLKPSGEARIMLYGRRSWVAYKRWLFGLLVATKRREPLPRNPTEAIWRFMESPGTWSYTPREIELMFRAAGFDEVRVEGFLNRYDERYLGPIARRVRRDFFLGVIAR